MNRAAAGEICRAASAFAIVGAMTNPFDGSLAGKTALVTGSSRGIGAATVRALAACGARCVVNYVADGAGRNKAEAQTVARDLPNSLLIECDVSNADQVRAMMSRIQ